MPSTNIAENSEPKLAAAQSRLASLTHRSQEVESKAERSLSRLDHIIESLTSAPSSGGGKAKDPSLLHGLDGLQSGIEGAENYLTEIDTRIDRLQELVG